MADYRSQLLDQQPFGGPLTGGAQPSALASALAGTPSFPDGADPMADATSYLSSIASPTPAPAPQQPYRGAILPISSGEDGQIHFDSNAGLLGAVKNAFTLPHDVYAGQVDPMSQEGISRATDMAATLGSGAPIPKPAGSIGIFGGRNALTADIGQLDEASALRSLRGMPGYENVDKDTMLQDTGWFRGLDGKDRFEISDHASSLQPGIATASTVGQAFDHPDLYAAYPHLADIGFVPGNYREGYGGSYMPGKNQITLNMAQPPEVQRGMLLHELQHAVQQHEGFASGSSPSILQNGLSDYMQTAGEVEARAAHARADMTPEQRRAAGVWTEEQLPEAKHQILYPLEKGQFYSQYARRNPVPLAYEPSIPKHTDDELLAAIMNKMMP